VTRILNSVIAVSFALCPLRCILCAVSFALCPLRCVLCAVSFALCPLRTVLVLCELSFANCPLRTVLCEQPSSAPLFSLRFLVFISYLFSADLRPFRTSFVIDFPIMTKLIRL